jgi:uncharacterized membrane protein
VSEQAPRAPTRRATRALIALGGLVPWLIAPARAVLPDGLSAWLYTAFGAACHQRPDRTLTLIAPMPVCSRCAGIYAGVVLAALWVRHRPSERALGWLLVVGVVLLGVDVLTHELALRPVWHGARIATGALLSYGVAARFLERVEA